MQLNQPIGDADCMLILGSRDDRVAMYAADISKRCNYHTVVISGGISHTQDLLATGWGKQTEAEHFRDMFVRHQGRGEVILETKAHNTGENASFSYELLEKRQILPETLLLVTKPYMERRALATFAAQWPGENVEIRVSSAGGTLREYCNDEQLIEIVIHLMVGDLQRILHYPELGLQSAQNVPDDVLEAYE